MSLLLQVPRIIFRFWGFNIIFLSLIFLFLGLFFVQDFRNLILEINLGGFLILDLKLYFYFDWIRCIFSAVVLFISRIVIFYREEYIKLDAGKVKFLILVILFVLSIILIILSLNIVSMLLGWDGLGLVSYCLVIFYQNELSNRAGMITVLRNRLGDIGLILSLIFLVCNYSWDLQVLVFEDKFLLFSGLLLILGALTKRAQIPFSAWLPAAIAAPTPVSALVHSSTLVTAGVYLIIRINSFFLGSQTRKFLLFVSVLTIFLAGTSALIEIDLKKIIALSTLRQLGVIIIILSLRSFNLAFFHLITHAIFKAILFLCAGVVIHNSGGAQDIRFIGLVGLIRPFIRSMIVLASLSLAGFPFLSGFYSKDLILEFFYSLNNRGLIFLFLVLGTVFTSIYSLRLGYYCLFKGHLIGTGFFRHERFLINSSIYTMGIVVIVLGCFFSWCIFLSPTFFFLSFYIKIFNISILISGVYLGFIFLNFIWSRRESGRLGLFLGSIWFLPLLRGQSVLKGLKYYKKNFLLEDQGWLEDLGGQKVFLLFNTFSFGLEFFQVRILKNFLFVFILSVIFFLFFCSLNI